jgi:hypothetical protein
MPDTPGRRLKVLAAGLQQLGTTCEKIAGELSAGAVRSFVAASPWQSNAATVNIGAAGAGEDLIALAQRVGTRAADYSKAFTMYTDNEDGSAARFRGLVI